MSDRRIVVDVSDLVAWHGNLSGIQRVVAEMAYRYESIGATFCYYLESERKFFDLGSFSDFMNARTQPIASQATARPSKPSRVSAARIKKVVHLATPPAVWAVKARLASSNTSQQQSHQAESFAFSRGDTLLIFGAHWDKPNYTRVLVGLKMQHELFVGHLINDLIPVFDSAHVAEVEHIRFPKYMREISEIADLIYLESESTARDYEKFIEQQGLQSVKPATQLIVLGENIKNTKATRPGSFTTKEFVLSVGTMEVRKNHALLYMTYKRAHELHVDLPHMVLVGRKGWLADDIYYQLVHDADIKHKFTLVHDANDENLSWLYKNCQFVVFPSHYEGWGLPVAEAAHYGKVTAASNRSSIPEVVGDAAIYFSAYSSDECLQVIQKLTDKKFRAKYEKRLADRSPNTWDATFSQTHTALTQYS